MPVIPPTGAAAAVQVGVGPGAVVVQRDGPATSPPDPAAPLPPVDLGPGVEVGRALATLGAAPSLGRIGADGTDDAGSPVRCPVLGTGPLATRLWQLLGSLPTDTPGPVQVVVHQHLVPPEVGVSLSRAPRLTLPVVAQAHRTVVGPLVGDRRTPCLHCLDLHRRDRDPAWPTVATTLGHPAEQVRAVRLPDALVRATEGLVLLLVTATAAGQSPTPGTAFELGPQAPHLVVRRWQHHPRCGWHHPQRG